MSGAFDDSFAGRGRPRFRGKDDPALVAACSDQPAEAAVIGAMLRDETLIDTVADQLRSEDFSDYLFGELFGAMLSMRAAGEVTAPIVLAQRFTNDDELRQRGGARYLSQLAHADDADRGPGYVAHLVEVARRRYLAAAVAEVAPDLVNTSVPLASIAGQLEDAMAGALFWTSSRPAIGFAQAWDAVFAKIAAIAAGEVTPGLKVPGLAEWDRVCGGGMLPGQMILLGARPAMGKTALALSIARRVALSGAGVLFLSREMPVEQLMFRVVADMLHEEGSSVSADDLVAGRISRHDLDRAAAVRARIDATPLVFEEPTNLTASNVGALVRRHQREMAQRGVELKLVVVDYLQLLDTASTKGTREQEVGETSRGLKSAARATGVTMLVLSQLSRAPETRDDKRPILSDLRDSGSLEQDADTVVFAFRAEYYLRQKEPPEADAKKREAWELEMNIEQDQLDIYSSKVRQGAPARARIRFYLRHQAIRSSDHARSGGWGGAA